jgi:hypothetical protein
MNLSNLTRQQSRELDSALNLSVIETILEDLDAQVTDGLKEIRARDERISELEDELAEARDALGQALATEHALTQALHDAQNKS